MGAAEYLFVVRSIFFLCCGSYLRGVAVDGDHVQRDGEAIGEPDREDVGPLGAGHGRVRGEDGVVVLRQGLGAAGKGRVLEACVDGRGGPGRLQEPAMPCDVQLAIMMRLAFEDPTRSLGATGPVL